MKELNINIERTGFPIKVAGLEFFFDASVEGIESYQHNYQSAIESIKDMQETDDAIEDRKKVLTKSYDTILGEGSFELLYNKVPDIIALNNAFFTIVEGIDKHITEVVAKQTDKVQKLLDEYEIKNTDISNTKN